jgi:hypothetical protein
MALTYGLSAQEDQNRSHFGSSGQFIITPVRVHFSFINLEQIKIDYPALFEKYGGYNTLGGILFDSFTNPITPTGKVFEDNLLKNYNFAKPLFPNIQHIPLINEITYVVPFPSTNTQNPRNIDLNQVDYYYFQPLNMWNTLHQNAFPNPLISYNKESDSQQKNISYQQSQAGATVNQDSPEPGINLGKTFKEKDNIKYLQPYEGDIIYEGRWGHSIRFGSTVLNQNPWSSTGEEGSPILILRNGQAPSNTETWIPTIEEINNDLGSIYFGSNQQLPLNAASINYSSYQTSSTTPISPDKYTSNQIIITSGRLVFNSSQDHILLSSNTSINLNAINSINIDTDSAIIQSKKLYLGDKDADEPLLLGNQTVDLLDTLLESLKSFLNICETLTGTDPGIPLAPLNAIAVKINITIEKLQSDLKNIISKDNFTI